MGVRRVVQARLPVGEAAARLAAASGCLCEMQKWQLEATVDCVLGAAGAPHGTRQ